MNVKTQKGTSALWTKGYILILLSNGLIFLGYNMLLTGIPMYAQQNNFGNAIAGLTTTLFSLSSLLFRPLFGIMIDTKGRRAVMYVGTILTVVTVILYNFISSVPMLLALRLLHGVAHSALSTVCATMVADQAPPSHLSEGIAYSGIAMIVTAAVGPSMSISLVQWGGFPALFITALAVSVLSLVFALIVPYKNVKGSITFTAKELGNRVFEKTSIRPSIIALLVAATMGSISGYIPAFGQSRGIEGAGLFFTGYAVAALSVRLLSGSKMGKLKSTVVFGFGAMGMAVCFALLAVANSLPVVLAASIAYGLGNGLVMPIMSVVLMQRCGEDRRGAANAMLFAALDVGVGTGALIWGRLSEQAGYGWVYSLCAAVILMAMVLYCFLLSKHNLKRVSQ